MRGLSGECDDGALQCSEESERRGPSGGAGGDGPVSAAGADQAGDAFDGPVHDLLDLPPDRMLLAAELDPQGHHHAGDVSPAEDGVSPRQGEQLGDRIGLLPGGLTDVAHPVLIDPVDHRQRKVGLVLELVIERAARVARLAGHLLEPQVAVAVAGQPPGGRLEECASRAGAPLRLSRFLATYVHVCMLPYAYDDEAPGQRPHLTALANP